MCGIAGIIDFSSNIVDPTRLLQMATTLAHRGPDGEGAVFFRHNAAPSHFDTLTPRIVLPSAQNAYAALAHRRLAIIDLSERGAQPMSDDSKRYWITYNGEIYNHIELRTELHDKGYRFHSDSDTEVVLNAYRAWGAECLKKLNGMFAFAIWDAIERRLFCARDRLGIKPFYYHYAAKRLTFASEPKAILPALESTPAPNLAAIADYLSFSYSPTTDTMFQGVRKLGPGDYLVADASGIEVRSYWDPVFDPTPLRSEDIWVEELRALLDDAIRLQVRSDVPIGAHLSGGIDSSAVSCLASRHVPRLLTFTARFGEGGFFDETPYAKLVSRHVSSDYHEIVPEGFQLSELLPKIVYSLDEPVEAASVFGKYHVADIVSRSVKVVLGGQGGDELFGGYDWYIKNLFTATAFGATQPVPTASRFKFICDTVKTESIKRLAKSLWNNFGESNLPSVFCRNWSRFSRSQLSKVLHKGVLDSMPISPEQRFLDSFAELREQRDVDRMFKFDTRHYLQALLTSEDRLSMAFSVESRVPLLDHRIAELAGRVGSEAKTVPGKSKHLLRRALDGTVPSEILTRTDKRGFPTPIGTWLRDPNLNLMENFVFNNNSFAKRYFDLDFLRTLEKSRSYFSTDSSERLWRILNVCVWGKVFALD